MSRIKPRSSLYRDVWQMVCLHSSIASRMRCCTRDGRIGGRSGNLRTSSLRNSFVLICSWKGYPQFLTQMSRSCPSQPLQYNKHPMPCRDLPPAQARLHSGYAS